MQWIKVSITVIWVGSEAGVNGSVIFLSKGTNMQPRLRSRKLVTRYWLLEGYCVITDKAAYTDDETWAKVVKVVDPGIRKIKVSNVACVLPIIFTIYLTLHIYPSNFSEYDTWSLYVVGIPHILWLQLLCECHLGPLSFVKDMVNIWKEEAVTSAFNQAHDKLQANRTILIQGSSWRWRGRRFMNISHIGRS